MTKHRLLNECLLRLVFVVSPSSTRSSVIVCLSLSAFLSFLCIDICISLQLGCCFLLCSGGIQVYFYPALPHLSPLSSSRLIPCCQFYICNLPVNLWWKMELSIHHFLTIDWPWRDGPALKHICTFPWAGHVALTCDMLRHFNKQMTLAAITRKYSQEVDCVCCCVACSCAVLTSFGFLVFPQYLLLCSRGKLVYLRVWIHTLTLPQLFSFLSLKSNNVHILIEDNGREDYFLMCCWAPGLSEFGKLVKT